MKKRFVTSDIVRNYYDKHWLALCAQLSINAREHARFDKSGHMLGLDIADALVSTEVLQSNMIHLERLRAVNTDTEEANPVKRVQYKFGARTYEFIYLAHSIVVSEVV